MKVLAIVLLAVAAAKASPARVVGGSDTDIQKYPSMVQVEIWNAYSQSWNQECVATILNSRYLLSNIQCFELWSGRSRVRAGSSFSNSGGELRNVVRVEEHMGYRPPNQDGDIAVILIDQPLTYSESIQQALIPPQGFEVPDNAPVTLVGWGSTVMYGDINAQLQEASLNTVNIDECRRRYGSAGRRITDNMICSGGLAEGGIGACNDWGAPIFYNNMVVGVASWGYECGSPNYPYISTKVSSYTNWILESTATAPPSEN